MKKISLYMFSLLVLAGFSACDEDYTDWANPQSNPQEESKSGITAQVAGVTSEVVMDTYAEDSVVIAKLESLSGSDEIVGYKLQLAGNDKTLDIPFAEKDGAFESGCCGTGITNDAIIQQPSGCGARYSSESGSFCNGFR